MWGFLSLFPSLSHIKTDMSISALCAVLSYLPVYGVGGSDVVRSDLSA